MKIYVDYKTKKIVETDKEVFACGQSSTNYVSVYVKANLTDSYFVQLQFVTPDGRKPVLLEPDASTGSTDVTYNDETYNLYTYTLKNEITKVSGRIQITGFICFTDSDGNVKSRDVLFNAINNILKTTGYTDDCVIYTENDDDAESTITNLKDFLNNYLAKLALKADKNGNSAENFKAAAFISSLLSTDQVDVTSDGLWFKNAQILIAQSTRTGSYGSAGTYADYYLYLYPSADGTKTTEGVNNSIGYIKFERIDSDGEGSSEPYIDNISISVANLTANDYLNTKLLKLNSRDAFGYDKNNSNGLIAYRSVYPSIDDVYNLGNNIYKWNTGYFSYVKAAASVSTYKLILNEGAQVIGYQPNVSGSLVPMEDATGENDTRLGTLSNRWDAYLRYLNVAQCQTKTLDVTQNAEINLGSLTNVGTDASSLVNKAYVDTLAAKHASKGTVTKNQETGTYTCHIYNSDDTELFNFSWDTPDEYIVDNTKEPDVENTYDDDGNLVSQKVTIYLYGGTSFQIDTTKIALTSGSTDADDVKIVIENGKITATLSTTLKEMANNEGVRVANEKVRIANYNTFINALANQQGTLCVCDVDDDGNLVLTKVNATLDTDGIQNQTE